MIATSIPVGAIRAPASRGRLPGPVVLTAPRRPMSGPVDQLLSLAVGVWSSIEAQRATLSGLYRTLEQKQAALAKAKTQAKRLTLQAQIEVLEDKIATLKAQIAAAAAAGQQQPPPVASGTPLWQWGLVGLTAVVVIGGGGYLVLGARRRRRSS